MKASWLHLLLCCLQVSGADFLRDSSRSISLRLTAYDLPETVLYYLPSLPGRRAINQTRPQRNTYLPSVLCHQWPVQ